MVNWAQSPSGFNSTPEAQGEPHSRATWPSSIHTRRPSLQGKRTSRLMFFNSESGDLKFPGTGLRKNLQESKGQHVQTQVTEGYADKNQA